ncbi:hypothetical protein PRUPE_3G239400 [Prunus persica]|uniref:Uncharacterized protein n=1 Tax=Prunus persica TaxID=3760 RepID=A0A251Q4L9_PRUPE|nr:hypothetical protein PRUPE_3G239400 [Prunus persica]
MQYNTKVEISMPFFYFFYFYILISKLITTKSIFNPTKKNNTNISCHLQTSQPPPFISQRTKKFKIIYNIKRKKL